MKPRPIIIALLLALGAPAFTGDDAHAQQRRAATRSRTRTRPAAQVGQAAQPKPRVATNRGPIIADRKFVTRMGERNAPVEAWRSRNVSRFIARSSVSILARLASRSARFSNKMALTRTNKALIESTNPGKGREYIFKSRRAWLPLATDRSLRRWTVRNLNRDMRLRSRQIEKLMDERLAAGEQIVYDDIIIGAGPVGVVMANQILEADPSRRVLVVDGSDTIGATFAEIGSGIEINSSSRAKDGDEAQPFGKGDNNPLPGSPVNVPDVDGNVKWAEAAQLADAVTFSAAASGADFMLSSFASDFTDATRILGAPADATLRVRGADGKQRQVYANNVIVSSGVGSPSLRLVNTRVQKKYDAYLARERAKLARGETPSLMLYQDALSMVNRSFLADANQGDAFAPFRVPYRRDKTGALVADQRNKPKIAVIGGGDSGKTLMNLLFGTGPSNAADQPGKLSHNQLGQIGDVDWIVGEEFRDVTEFYGGRPGVSPGVRPRYARPTAEIRAGKIRPIEGRAIAIEPTNSGKTRITYEYAVRPMAPGERVPAEYDTYQPPDSAQTFMVPKSELDGPSGLASLGREVYTLRGQGGDERLVWESTQVYDRVIVAAGFRNAAPPLLGSVTGQPRARIEDPAVFEVVRGRIQGLGPRALARQVKGSPQFKVIGVAAGDDLIEESATSGIVQNKAGLKVRAPRARALAQQIAKTKRAAGAFDSARADFKSRTKITRENTKSSFTIKRPDDLWQQGDARMALETGVDIALHMKHEMGLVLDSFDPSAFKNGELLTIEVSRGKSGEYKVEIPGVARGIAEQIVAGMRDSTGLIGLLELHVGERDFAGFKRNQTRLTFEVPVIGSTAKSRKFDYGNMRGDGWR